VLDRALRQLTRSLAVPLHFTVPWPPTTANKVWRPSWRGLSLDPRVREYFKGMSAHLLAAGVRVRYLAVDLEVRLELIPPKGRNADVDNIGPVVLDALTHAGLWVDDLWISRLVQERHDPRGAGEVWVTVKARDARDRLPPLPRESTT
jgi:crossover junction endodeoxyribonuclease RusA